MYTKEGGRVPSLNTGGLASFGVYSMSKTGGLAEFVHDQGKWDKLLLAATYSFSHPLLLDSNPFLTKASGSPCVILSDGVWLSTSRKVDSNLQLRNPCQSRCMNFAPLLQPSWARHRSGSTLYPSASLEYILDRLDKLHPEMQMQTQPAMFPPSKYRQLLHKLRRH